MVFVEKRGLIVQNFTKYQKFDLEMVSMLCKYRQFFQEQDNDYFMSHH